MKAWICKEWGDPASLVLDEAPVPHAGPRQVAIDVQLAAVNFPDLLMIAGKYQLTPPLPFVPGIEVAGTVVSVGEHVRGLQTGDRVAAILDHGAFAARALAQDIQTFRIPEAMDMQAAAALPTAYGTAYRALVDRAGLRAGETLLVLGAAGGVGLAAVELGRLLGARVIAAAGSKDKLALAARYGATHLVDYRRESIRRRVHAITDGAGANVVFDPVGGDAFDEALRCLAREGRLLVIGFASGRIPDVPAWRVLKSECSVIGVLYGGRRKPDEARANFARLLEWHLQGRLNPHVCKTFAFEELPAALGALVDRSATGKVLVRVAPGPAIDS